MTLYESIVLETRNGALGDTFELQELTSEHRRVMCPDGPALVEKYRIGFEFFMRTAIGTTIANYARDAHSGAGGYNVNKGAAAKFLRVAHSTYKVLADDQ
ncbi:hypothetical protein ACK9U2_002556 [Pseudomonas putida]